MTTDFPGGNGIVSYLPDGAVLLDRDKRDSVGDRWYWSVRMRSDRSGVVRVGLARPGILGRFGPWVRRGTREAWLSTTPIPDGSFDLPIEPGEVVEVSAAAPYGPKQLRRFIGKTRQASGVSWTDLTKSEDGRPVPLAVANHHARPTRTVLLTARHHACEGAGSFVLEGAVARFLEMRREGRGEALTTELIAAPIVDIDGVWRGDPGKARRPWDHNRDYQSRSRYRAVAALRTLIGSTHRPLFALDLHTPGLRGVLEERPYIVASGHEQDTRQARDLVTEAEAVDAQLLVFDEEWNDPASTGQRCCAAWLRSLRRTRLALTIEYPNAVDRGTPVTPECARRFGAVMIQGLTTLAARL
ncbi:MAG: hypothetical protein ACRDQW_03400 [Haloechinothrix sp.]